MAVDICDYYERRGCHVLRVFSGEFLDDFDEGGVEQSNQGGARFAVSENAPKPDFRG